MKSYRNVAVLLLVCVLVFTGCSSKEEQSSSGGKGALSASSANQILNGGLIDASGDSLYFANDDGIYQYANGESTYLRESDYDQDYGCFINATEDQLIYAYRVGSGCEIRVVDIGKDAEAGNYETIYSTSSDIQFMQLYEGYIYLAERDKVYRFEYPVEGSAEEGVETVYTGDFDIKFGCVYDERVYLFTSGNEDKAISMSLTGGEMKEIKIEESHDYYIPSYAFLDQSLYYTVRREIRDEANKETVRFDTELWKIKLDDLSSSKVADISGTNGDCPQAIVFGQTFNDKIAVLNNAIYVLWREPDKPGYSGENYYDVITRVNSEGAGVEEVYRSDKSPVENNGEVDTYRFYPSIDKMYSIDSKLLLLSRILEDSYSNEKAFRIEEADSEVNERNMIIDLDNPVVEDEWMG